MARQRRIIGSILKINLGDGFHTYARVLYKANYAFYDIKTKEDIQDLTQIVKQPILFIIAAYDYVVTKGRWIKIGHLPLEDFIKVLPMKFIQDLQKPDTFELYDSNTGKIVRAARHECVGLERAVVWETEQIEDRIRDHYNGTPNKWVEMMKIK